MGSVRTSIFGRPRRLSGQRRASPDYTVNCEEPHYVMLPKRARSAVAPRRQPLRILLALLVTFFLATTSFAAFPDVAHADRVYGKNNNWKRIYLSPAYHTSVAGARGECSFDGSSRAERTMARNLAKVTATLKRYKTVNGVRLVDFDRSGLVAQGFVVRVGSADFTEASARSNNFNAAAHVPMHSNASLPRGCDNVDDNKPVAGTRQIYRSGQGSVLPTRLRKQLAGVTPGTGDKVCTITACTAYSCLAELCSTDANSASYSETEFHDWRRGVRFLVNKRKIIAVRFTRAIGSHYS